MTYILHYKVSIYTTCLVHVSSRNLPMLNGAYYYKSYIEVKKVEYPKKIILILGTQTQFILNYIIMVCVQYFAYNNRTKITTSFLGCSIFYISWRYIWDTSATPWGIKRHLRGIIIIYILIYEDNCMHDRWIFNSNRIYIRLTLSKVVAEASQIILRDANIISKCLWVILQRDKW
jgi:hypothetical protein